MVTLEKFKNDLINSIDLEKKSLKKGKKFSNFLNDSKFFKNLVKDCSGLTHEDKSGDKGIDRFYWDKEGNPHIWQDKYKDSYSSNTIETELNKLLSNIEKGNGEICKNILIYIKNNPSSTVYYHFFTIDKIGSDKEKEKMIDAVSNFKNRLGTNLIFDNYNIETVYNYEIELIELEKNKEYSLPKKYFYIDYLDEDESKIAAVIGLVPIRFIVEFLDSYAKDHGSTIEDFFRMNCRAGLVSDSPTNENISETMLKEPQYFAAFNDGATNICSGIRIEGDKLFFKFPLSSDGCQTLHVLYKNTLNWGLLKRDDKDVLNRGKIRVSFFNTPAIEPNPDTEKIFRGDIVIFNNSRTKISKFNTEIATDYRARELSEFSLGNLDTQLITRVQEQKNTYCKNSPVKFAELPKIYESTINRNPATVFSNVNSLLPSQVLGNSILDDLYKNKDIVEYIINLYRIAYSHPIYRGKRRNPGLCIFHTILTLTIQNILNNTKNEKLIKLSQKYKDDFINHDNKYSNFYIKAFNLILNSKNNFSDSLKSYVTNILCIYTTNNNIFDVEDYSECNIVKDFKNSDGKDSDSIVEALRLFKLESNFNNTPGLKSLLLRKPIKLEKEEIEYAEKILLSINQKSGN